MKRLILVLLINMLPSSIFAIGGFGLQGGLALSKIGATKTIEGMAILNTAEFSNPYAVGAYLYVDAIPFIDIEIDHIFKIVFIPSKNIADLSFFKLPNNSASDINPPGDIPKLNLPLSILSIIATCPAICAGCRLGIFTVPVPKRMLFVS